MQCDRLFVQTDDWFFGVIRLFIVSRMSSILAMYSSLSSGADHIFFPPRLEVVAEEKNTDGFSPHLWHQFAFDCFFGDQPHGPPRPAFRRIATDHGNDPLALFGI